MIERLRAAGISVNTDWEEGERVLAQENGHTREMSRSQKRAMETASVSHDEEHQHAVISFADGAKVQQNSETTKEKRYKKELPPIQDDSSEVWRAVFKSLSEEISSDPRRRANAPVNTYSALNLLQRYNKILK